MYISKADGVMENMAKLDSLIRLVQSKYEIPKPLNRARDIITQLLYGLSYRQALNAARLDRLGPVELNETRLVEMSQLHGSWMREFFNVLYTTFSLPVIPKLTCIAVGSRLLMAQEAVNFEQARLNFKSRQPLAEPEIFAEFLKTCYGMREVNNQVEASVKYAW